MNEGKDKFKTLAFLQNRLVRTFFMPLGMWPFEVLEDKRPLLFQILRRYLPMQALLAEYAQINYLTQNFGKKPFLLLGHTYINLFLTAAAILSIFQVRMFIPWTKAYGELANFFYTTFDLEHFKDKGPNFKKVNAIVYTVSYYYAQITTGLMIGGMILYNALPMYNNYKTGALTNNLAENATYVFSIYYAVPGFNEEEHFWKATILNFYFTYCASIPLCIFDLFLSYLVFHIIGHMRVLIYNLQDIEKPKSQHGVRRPSVMQNEVTIQLFNDEENKIISGKLIEFVNHYIFIKRFTDDVSSLFGATLASSYLFHLVGCCLLLLECSQLDPAVLAQYGPLTFIIFGELIQLSVVFEILATESAKISDEVYCVPWEYMDVRNQRSFCIFLQMVQTPATVCALGLTDVGVKTMAYILKTTFSYFAFLRTFT